MLRLSGISGIPEGLEKQRKYIQIWIKSNDRDLKGEEVRTMRIKMAPDKTWTSWVLTRTSRGSCSSC